jgi:hypothetical protein
MFYFPDFQFYSFTWSVFAFAQMKEKDDEEMLRVAHSLGTSENYFLLLKPA